MDLPIIAIEQVKEMARRAAERDACHQQPARQFFEPGSDFDRIFQEEYRQHVPKAALLKSINPGAMRQRPSAEGSPP